MQGSLVVQFPLVWFPSKYEITFLNNTSNFQIERKTLRTILEAKHVTFYNFKKSSNQMWGPYWRTHTTQARRNTSWAQPHILAEVKSSSTKDLINITYLLKFIKLRTSLNLDEISKFYLKLLSILKQCFAKSRHNLQLPQFGGNFCRCQLRLAWKNCVK